jgi:opacity protein-like surface antigen
MKKLAISVVLLLCVASVTAQEIYLETGKTMASFTFKTSQGQTLDNLQSTSHNFLSAGFTSPILTKNLKGSLGASYFGVGAIGSDDIVGNFMKWDMNYLGLNLGLNYSVYQFGEATMYLKGSTSASFLMQGTQTLNNKVINLKNTDDLNKVLFGFKLGLGFSYTISDNLAVYAQYMYGKSLKLKNTPANSSNTEELTIVSNNVGIGLLINISK